MYLSVLVPAYNEEENLKENIQKFVKYLDSKDFEYEIIIVNDGSKDKTSEVAANLASDTIQVIDMASNQGKGAAIRKGLLVGQGEYLMFLDADNATSIDHLDMVFPLLNDNAELVIGSRNHKDVRGAIQIKKQILIKRIMGTCGNRLIRFIIGSSIHDTQCGFKVFSKNARDKIIPKTKINRWAIDIEILLLANLNDLSIAIIPVTWHCGPVSRVGVKGYVTALKELAMIKFFEMRGDYNDDPKNSGSKL